MEANLNIRCKTFSTLVAYDARSAGNVARLIRNPESVSVAASRCRHWLFVTLFIFLVACERPETKKTETPERPEFAPAPKATANDTVAVPRGSYAEVVDNVAPAVVTIRAEKRVRAPRQHPFFNDPLFRDFFGGLFEGAQRGAPRSQVGLGSGVIVKPDGYIVTNHHVIDGAAAIKIETPDHRIFDAKLVGSDPPSDLAVIKIAADKLPVLALADSDKARVGDVVLAVGNPLGIGQTVTAGIAVPRAGQLA